LSARRSGGDTTVRIARTRVPKLPHERDESAGRGRKPPEKRIAKAAADLASGRQDTDRGPQTARLARKLKTRS
jgi:hypothetical protein